MSSKMCVSCVCRIATVVHVGGLTTASESCSHPANPGGFANAHECQQAGRYRTLDEVVKAKERAR